MTPRQDCDGTLAQKAVIGGPCMVDTAEHDPAGRLEDRETLLSG
jgi:hypothetical protein